MNTTTLEETISKTRAEEDASSHEGASQLVGVSRQFTCVGCHSAITDQYVLQVSPDLEWHTHCLRCIECNQQLNEQNTCFVRDGRAYCKADYLRLFGIKCVGCRLGFSMSDLVMRSRHRIFHLDCFRCSICLRRLVPGDEYALDDDHDPVTLYCRQDYDATNPHSPLAAPIPSSQNQDDLNGGAIGDPLTPIDKNNRTTTTSDEATDGNNDIKTTTNENGLTDSPHHNSSTTSSTSSSCSASVPGGGGVGGGGVVGKSPALVGKRSGGGAGGGGSRGSGGGRTHHKTSDHPKTTRVRTVLNEKQLHTLRTCYGANPRPDALMKDQLVEMTGLSSRVIRVWFQNKRCKDKKRTILIKQIQQQHHDKLQGVPLIASSPVHHDPSSSSLQPTPVEIHQFIHHHTTTPSWNPIPPSVASSGSEVITGGSLDYPNQPPLQISADARDPGQGQAPSQGQGHVMAFQQLLSSFGESDDDDTVVSLEEASAIQGPASTAAGLHPLLSPHPHPLPVSLGATQPTAASAAAAAALASRVAMQRITRFNNELHLHPSSRLSLHLQNHHQHHHQHHHHISQSPHLFSSSNSSSSSHFISSPAHLNQQSTLKAFDAKC